jgi:lysophospholipase L1-like esterase
MIVAAGLIAVFLFEILLRAIGYSAPIWYQPHPQLGWTLRPGVAGWFTREGRAFVEVGASGRRDRDYPLHKPEDVYRIAVLGDSYAEAMQVKREEAFWALLPARLQACGFQPDKRIEVLNFGVSGYGTAQEYLMLESTALRYRPDVVLLQFTNGNDVRNNSFALEEEKARPFFMLEADGALRADASFAAAAAFRNRSAPAWDLFRRTSDHSRVLQLVRSVRETPLVRKAQAHGVEQGLEPLVLAPPRDPRWDEAWRITEGLIAKTADLAARNGARFVVVTVPYAIQVHPDRKLREALQAELGVPDLFYPDRRIAEFAKRRGIQAVPLASEMQRLAEGDGTYFHGFASAGLGRGHWNPAGHRAAAEIIARSLCAG